MKIHNFEQRSSEWYEIRKGKMTASNAQAIGNCGKGLESYILQVMSEYYEMTPEEKYTNSQLERGIELEEQARDIYEMLNNAKVEQVGFIEGDEYSGCSPDGLIGEDGGLEIKCHNNLTHFKLLLDKKIDSGYLWQIQMNLFITGRKWWDYMAYNPNFKENMFIERVEPDAEMFDKIKKGLELGKYRINEIKNKYGENSKPKGN